MIDQSNADNPQAAGANGTPFAGGQTWGGASTAPPDPYDYSGDPALAKIHAINVAARANARTQALAAAKTLAIRFGDATGITDDPNAQAEAANNPYSTLATLLKGYKDTALSHDEALNKDNLFFSGARVKQLGEDANAYQHQTYDARNAALDQFGGIQSGLASALSGIDQSDIAAEGDAYGRAQARALANGYDPGAGTNAVTNTDNQNPQPGTTTHGNTTTTVSNGAGPSLATSTYGKPQSTSFGGSAGPYIGSLPKALAAPKPPKAPKLPNAYLTNSNKRG